MKPVLVVADEPDPLARQNVARREVFAEAARKLVTQAPQPNRELVFRRLGNALPGAG